jgi:hypothetical protein
VAYCLAASGGWRAAVERRAGCMAEGGACRLGHHILCPGPGSGCKGAPALSRWSEERDGVGNNGLTGVWPGEEGEVGEGWLEGRLLPG